MSTRLTLLLCLWGCLGVLHAQSLWTDLTGHAPAISGKRYIIPQQYRTLHLEADGMQALLSTVSEQAPGVMPVTLALPMPDGSSKRFLIYETPLMAPELQARYPESRSYTGIGMDDPTASLKCDLTPWGFHAMVRSKQFSTVFIDPYAQGNRDYYISYYKKDLLTKGKNAPEFSCGIQSHNTAQPENENTPEFQGDCQLRRYRLALACTREYSAFHGDTKPLVMAAMVTSMNRVNGVYEDELAVTMQMVANNDTLIYLSTMTDPYSNNNGDAMLNQNRTTCNNRIGLNNYDIGHVFSTGGGGIAGLGVVCTSDKAQGVTGSGTPIGDAFDIDYVAHEMGHQFGANHTQNNDCNSEAVASMEPGSASTIMGYAGICAPDVQLHSDDYFHAISLQEIGLFITTGAGNTCPVKTITGNSTPTVNGGPNFTIPKSTPFALTATGSDANGDPLTYCWEQMDPQFATMPPVSTSATGPLFRSYTPVASPTRYFPNLPDLINNVNSDWEELPGVARTMNFRVTARDNNPAGGCTEEDDVLVTVAGNAGPFVVTAPNTNVLWYVGESKAVTWSVANTNIAPVNATQVRISLSTDGGYTYPYILANSVPNNGSANVTVPNQLSNKCRIKVEGVGNIFFDISNQNFRIELPPFPSFTLVNSVSDLTICAGDTASFTLQTQSIAGFTGNINLTTNGNPLGSTVAVSAATIAAGQGANVQIYGITPLMSGNYNLVISGTADTLLVRDTVALTILPGSPALSTPLSPADGATGLGTGVTLQWTEVNFASTYTVQVSLNADFSTTVYSQTLSGTSADISGLQPGKVYYWRVRAANFCGVAAYSETFAFQVQNLQCNQTFTSTDVPQVIDDASVNTALSVLDVPVTAVIGSAQVNIQISHTWVGDLEARLTTPWGADIVLFDQPGVPGSQYGCGNDNINVTFSDAATNNAAALEGQCNTNPALSGTFQPIMPLSVLNGQDAGGEWQLYVDDNVGEDGGSIDQWSMTFCFQSDIPAGAMVHNNTLSVSQGSTEVITTAYLQVYASGQASQLTYTLLELPLHGTLLLNGNLLGAGATFTQADIDAGALSYTHNGDQSLTDNFHFDVYDAQNFSWLHNQVFSIVILQNDLTASATVTHVVSCYDGNDGAITVEASGLDGNYEYVLNNGDPQTSNVFSNLAAGSYTVVVTGQFGFSTTVGPLVLSNPAQLIAGATVDADQITASSTGGAGPYTYRLDEQNYQASPVFESVPNGIHVVSVQDANGCVASTQVIVAVNSLLAFTEAAQNISCFGGANGVLVVTAAGSTPPFEYSLNGADFQTSNVFTGLGAGFYTAIVRDASSMVVFTNEVELTQPTQLTLEANNNINDVVLTPSGGTPPYTLTINDEPSDVFEFIDLEEGEYTFVVTDANGCSAVAQATALGNTLVNFFQAVSAVSCAGDQDGVIGLCIDGGYGPLTATITPEAGTFAGSSNGSCAFLASFFNLPPDTYTITITDSLGFSIITGATVTAPEPLTLEVTHQADTLIALASGGTFSYEYSLDGENWQSEQYFPGLTEGYYTVFVRDIKLCSDSLTYFLNLTGTVDPATAWGVSVSPNPGAGLFNLRMTNAPGDLSGEITDMTGRNLRNLDFHPGQGAFQTQIDLQNLPQGMYVLRLTDGKQTGALRLSVVR